MDDHSNIPTFADTRDGALALINWQYDWDAVQKINQDLNDGTAQLIPDPQVAGVWGLVGPSGRVLAILYTKDADTEEADVFEDRYL